MKGRRVCREAISKRVRFAKHSFDELVGNSYRVFTESFETFEDVTAVPASGDESSTSSGKTLPRAGASSPLTSPPSSPVPSLPPSPRLTPLDTSSSESSSSSGAAGPSNPHCHLPRPATLSIRWKITSKPFTFNCHISERTPSSPPPVDTSQPSSAHRTEGSTASSPVGHSRSKREAKEGDVPSPAPKRHKADSADLVHNPRNRAAIRRKRGKEMAKKASRNYATDPEIARRVVASASSLEVEVDPSKLRIVASGYTGLAGDEARTKTPEHLWSLEELAEEGFEVVQWDGISPVALVDEKDRVIAVLAGRPEKGSYLQSCDEAVQLIKDLDRKYATTSKKHLRGRFAAVHAGFSYGNGMLEPGVVTGHRAHVDEIIEAVTNSKCFNRIAGFGNSAFSTWAPKVHDYIANRVECVYRWCEARGKKTMRPFKRSKFTMFTVNSGPKTFTFKHRDVMNIAYGWCCITALGSFNADLGGHLVLHDLKIAVRFPHGSTILIPSATFAHSNVPIATGWRGSFTQYTPGGLLRWADQNYMTAANFAQADPTRHARWLQLRQHYYQGGLDLYSTLGQLKGES